MLFPMVPPAIAPAVAPRVAPPRASPPRLLLCPMTAPAIAPSVPPVTAPCWVLGPVPTHPLKSAPSARKDTNGMALLRADERGLGSGASGRNESRRHENRHDTRNHRESD